MHKYDNIIIALRSRSTHFADDATKTLVKTTRVVASELFYGYILYIYYGVKR